MSVVTKVTEGDRNINNLVSLPSNLRSKDQSGYVMHIL